MKLEEYQRTLEEAKGVFFGGGSRGILTSMTLYHRSVDYWVTIKLLFEYSIEGAVVLSNKKIEPFQLVELSSGNNVEFFVLDVIRIIISILIAALCTALPIYNMR